MLNKRRKFRRYDDPTKTYYFKRTKEQTIVWAKNKRQGRLTEPTEAEQEFNQMLSNLGIAFEREVIFWNGPIPIFLDFFVKGSNLAFEIDGGGHKLQLGYDRGRDEWLKQTHSITTIRFKNNEVLKTPERVKDMVKMLCYNVSRESIT